jgi:amidohydrolase
MQLIEEIVGFAPEIALIRRDIHAHPELAYAETRTAALVAELLAAWGLEVATGIGGTGVVGTLRGEGPARVGLRADMDALPLQELNEFGHRSTHPGRMHACGHDGHVAMLLAAARFLAAHPPPGGTVHFIFQPAEEHGAGAQAMIDDGLFERFPCDAVFGMHNWPGMPVGTFGLCAGPMLASANEFEITIQGQGSHAALPHTGRDPIWIACQLVNALQGIVSREKKPVDAAVLSVTQIHAGDAYNIVPDQAVIRGTVRTFDTRVTDLFERRITEIGQGLPTAFGATGKVVFKRTYPPLVNHPAQTEFARSVAASLVGPGKVIEFEPTMGSEDFAYMLLARPGCYIGIGNGDGGHRDAGHGAGACVLHNPSYDFNDEIIPLGASYWVGIARAALAGNGPSRVA